MQDISYKVKAKLSLIEVVRDTYSTDEAHKQALCPTRVLSHNKSPKHELYFLY